AFLRSQYDANLFYADAMVATVLRGLADGGLDARTLVIVTADHGEAFGEHGRFTHNSTPYDEMIRVPFIWKLPPGLGGRPARVAEPGSLVDVVPPLERLFGLASEPSDGDSLVPDLLGVARAPRERPLYAQAGRQVAVVIGQAKLIRRAPAVDEPAR